MSQFGFMSTTLDKAVAIKYGKDWDTARDLSFMFDFPMDGLNKGAIIQASDPTAYHCSFFSPVPCSIDLDFRE